MEDFEKDINMRDEPEPGDNASDTSLSGMLTKLTEKFDAIKQ